MKLVILGNGFDLHHGLKTSFSDFRSYLIKSKNEEYSKLAKDVDFILRHLDSNSSSNNELLWNDIENIFGLGLQSNSKRIINEIEVFPTITKLTKLFYNYLKTISNENITVRNGKIENELLSTNALLTFNYTKTYNQYIDNGSINTFHIHGNLSNNNLPIIGYFYSGATKLSSTDFSARYGGKAFHKPALAFKQNEIDFEKRLDSFTKPILKSIDEVVIIGYSFGKSDFHIFDILNKILIPPVNQDYIPSSNFEKIRQIRFKIFNYNEKESKNTIRRIKQLFDSKNRKSTVLVNQGYDDVSKDLITYELINY